MLTVIGVILVIGLIFLVMHAMGKLAQLWPAVLVLFIIELIRLLPLK